jgi:hypothetical protein
LLLFFKKEESSFSEEKEAKRLYSWCRFSGRFRHHDAAPGYDRGRDCRINVLHRFGQRNAS